MSALAIIGDDLTGAMDTGVLFVKKWPSVSVVFDDYFIKEMSQENDALIIDTESRNVSPDKAYASVGECVKSLGRTDLRLIYKKIDSTLRGNVGKELLAILDEGAFDMIALVPALPLNGRITVNGYHYLNGKLLTESDLASDPFSPVVSSYIPEIVNKQVSVNTAVVELKDIRGGSSHLTEVINEMYQAGCRIAVMDVENEADLDNISAALGRSSLKILPAGSAGLFSRMYMNNTSKVASAPVSDIRKDKPVVVISGSPAKMSKLQIEYAKTCGTVVIKLDGARVIAEERIALGEIQRVKSLALSYLKEGKNIIIDGAGEGKKDLSVAYSGKRELLLETSKMIQEAISCIAMEIADKAEISGLMIFGGDTALSISRRLGAKALRILGEVEPLVPYGIFTGGKLDGVYVATKAGGFGKESIILKTTEFFRKTGNPS